MRHSNKTQKLSAFILLITFSIQTFWPGVSYALTSGPSTPEMKAFEPASVSDMVDLFSGDFSYNIPLMDVGGYPVNIAYHAGAHPEEEASWVGFGWSLNPGAINRQLRGLPDDFNGDKIEQIDNKKPNKTYTASINFTKKRKGKRRGKVRYKLSLSYNNYTGYSASLGVPLYSFSVTKQVSSPNTQNLNDNGKSKSFNFFGGAGLNSSSSGGVSPYGSFDVNYKTVTQKERELEQQNKGDEEEYKRALTECQDEAKMLKDRLNDNVDKAEQNRTIGNHSASIDFERFQPPGLIDLKMDNTNIGGSLTLGFKWLKKLKGIRIEGSYMKQELDNNYRSAPAYGFPNSVDGKDNEDALLDYNIEKDNAYCKELPNLGVPVFNNDLYSVTSNAGSMQFRSYLRGSGVFNRQKIREGKFEPVDLNNIGLELGFGNIFHIGVPLQPNYSNNESGKWTARNAFLDAGDFKNTQDGNLANRAFCLKRVGEQTKQDNNYFNRIGGTSPVAVNLSNGAGSWAWGFSKAENNFRTKTNTNNPINDAEYLAKTEQPIANHSITYLNSIEASKYALDEFILDYTPNILPTTQVPNKISRTSQYRAMHHISQYTVTQDNGQRMVYGIPVYNTKQEEASFSIDYQPNQLSRGFATYQPNQDNTVSNNKGKDHYFHKYITPAYTTGHLLSAILSPDYVDATGDGISDDDLGSAVKFNYSKLQSEYTWRTPHVDINNNTNNTANYNEGLKSDYQDDKGNYTWGKKEIWNLHSIESKTMVALFYTSDRQDGLGANGENGGINNSVKLKKLYKIELYSKSELYAHPTNPTPIKTVHFEYDETYSLLMNGLPNTQGNKGKLALKSVYFTYGKNTKGSYHKYQFSYKQPTGSYASCNTYQEYQSDRWGSYKDKSKNPGAMDNFEYSYSTQNKIDADEYASFWQLNKIELPSGAIINVEYESDDYAYVQDKKAAQMLELIGVGDAKGQSTDFATATKIFVKLPVAVTSKTEFYNRYLKDLKFISFRALVDLYKDNIRPSEYVAGYAEIDVNEESKYEILSPTEAWFTIKTLKGYNPIAKAAWQKLKLEFPKLAYSNLGEPGDDPDFVDAIQAIGEAFINIGELRRNFNQMCNEKGYGNSITLAKSWVRLNTPTGLIANGKTTYGKLGGGLRVKRITINDQWQQMSNITGAVSGSYGQEYEYTTEQLNADGVKEKISSGVASYEPSNGGDENPFKEPINYQSKTFFTQPKFFHIEKPMGESYFPGASVGYSKVTVKNIGADGSVGSNGYNVNEFYTAKDFPTKVTSLPMEKKQPNLKIKIKLWGATMPKTVAVSQGYAVENNNMHGKQKAEAIYGKNDVIISSAKYNYKTNNASAPTLDLNNNVPTAKYVNGNIEVDKTENTIVGMDIDMFTEMNQAKTENIGVSLDPSFGFGIKLSLPPRPQFYFKLNWPKPNWEKRLYRSSTTIKLINRFGILESVEKTVNGSYSKTTNMLWDEETGEVLLTKTNNEFNDDIYNFSYPAHWYYNTMGQAYKNEGIFIQNFTTDATTGEINNFTQYLVEGDELIDLNANAKYWVTKPNATSSNFYLINNDGNLITSLNTNIKIMRSGRRNLAQASVGSVVTMINPIATTSNLITFNTNSKVLQAKAVEYSNEWNMPVADVGGYQNTPGNCSALRTFFDYLITDDKLFTTQANNIKVRTLAQEAGITIGSSNSCSLLDNNADELFYAITTNTTGNQYKAHIGNCTISIDAINPSATLNFSSLITRPCGSTGNTVCFAMATTKQAVLDVNFTHTVKNIDACISAVPVKQDLNSKVLLASYVILYTFPNIRDHLWSHTKFYVNDLLNFSTLNIAYAYFKFYPAPLGINMCGITDWRASNSTTGSSSAGLNCTGAFLALDNTKCKFPNFNKYSTMPITQEEWDAMGYVKPPYTPVILNSFSKNVPVIVNAKPQVKHILNTNENDGFDLVNNIPFVNNNNANSANTTNCPADDHNEIWKYVPATTPDRCYPEQQFVAFASNNEPNPALRPKLYIDYRVPANTITVAKLHIWPGCVANVCNTAATVNPYTTGLLGNWRAKKEWLYDTKRIKNTIGTSNTNLCNSGYFAAFNPFSFAANAPNSNWQWRSQANKFNLKGEEIENVDPLQRYNAAQYGYLQTVPIAVGSNAKYREIGYDGFEDYKFSVGTDLNEVPSKCDIQDHFSCRVQEFNDANVNLDNTKAHTGNTSLQILNGFSAIITKPLIDVEPDKVYAVNNNQYQITNSYLRFGFSPSHSSKYIVSGWVYDGIKTSNTISNFTLTINGTNYNVNDAIQYSKVYMVEGWKRFEIEFTTPTTGNDISIEFGATGSNINIDDIRVHPYNAQLKSFAYDVNSMRLMAELDENNFATFYEYDDEGTLIRVKKETEKGISTIKETRSSIRKNNK